MAITAITDVAQFDTVTGVVNSSEVYHTVNPSFKFGVGTSVLTDSGRMHNDVFKFHLRFDSAFGSKFKIMLGCDVNGVGRAIQLDFTPTEQMVRLVNQSGIDVAYDSVIQEKDVTNLFIFNDAQFMDCKIIISINKIEFYIQNRLCISYANFTTVGTHWGFCNLTASNQAWVSDLFYYTDQILYGNVNLNGAPDSSGVVALYNQATYDLVEKVYCDLNGEYMIFLDDDPANFNKYFLYGYVDGLTHLQPRGVSNITL